MADDQKWAVWTSIKSVHLSVTIHKENDIQILEDNVMNKIIESIKHYWTDHKVIAGVVILVIVAAVIL